MSNRRVVKSSESVAAEVVEAGTGAKRQFLISGEEGPKFALKRLIMEPDGGMPKHTNAEEHEQYVLKGKVLVGIGEKAFEVNIGDAVLIPEGVPHWYEVDEKEGFEFLCIVANKEDVIDVGDEPGYRRIEVGCQ